MRTSEKLATALNLNFKKLSPFVGQTDNSKVLGAFIQKARLESGLSYSAFAKLCGLSRTQIHILEQYKTKTPHWSTIVKLSQIDTVDFQELKKICGYD